MKKTLVLFAFLVVVVLNAAAAFDLTATKVTVQDVTVDKTNYFVTVNAHTSSGEYEVAFDVWPKTNSAIGSFTAADKTIAYVSSFVHKTKANDNPVNMWYYPEDTHTITLSIVKKNETTCTLSGSIQAARSGTTYTYNIAAFDFAYSEDGMPDPEPDPYRFEPTTPTTINFVGDVVSFKQKTSYVNITLNEMANETYDWIELDLYTETLAWPAGTYSINTSEEDNTLSASAGYLGTQHDDPCYVAIRGDKDNWGQYTPYYLVSGTITVAYNTKTDTIFVTGQAKSYNGTTVNINVKSYNNLFVPEDEPKEPEFVTLDIDSVVIAYMREDADKENNKHPYTFNFFSDAADGYPNVLLDVMLSDSMKLSAGTYTLEKGQLSGIALFQNQEDFNAYFFGGQPYVFTTVSLTLKDEGNGKWTYSMFMKDEIGSEYSFTLTQTPHLINYPEDTEEIDPKDQPYIDEQKEKAVITAAFDSILWKDATVAKDGILDIYLVQRNADANGLRAAMQLGFYTTTSQVMPGTYPVNGTEEDNTFSASLGRYGNVLIPCYLCLLDNNSWVHAVWYIVEGSISVDYLDCGDCPDDGVPDLITGECKTYFGSTVRFSYQRMTEAIEHTQATQQSSPVQKVLRNGNIYILRDGHTYTITGAEVK